MIYSLASKSNAKINLFLHVINKRSDGYHTIESLIAFTSLHDVVTITTDDKLKVEFTGSIITQDNQIDPVNNTVYKAAKLLSGYAKIDPNVRITINKSIPIAAGLGGGSANAATVLRLLKQLWSIDVSNQELSKIALEVGADTVACLHHKLCIARGIGEQAEVLTQDFGLQGMQLLLVNPGVSLLAKTVYQAYRGPYRDPMSFNNLKQIFSNSSNDLQKPASHIAPEINEVISALQQQEGCKLARMSGSGATCFGIFEDSAQLQKAAENMNSKWWSKTATIF
ncbi:4-diphosphocytidyl-2-C-methyl-D-erythritol kinase [Rickettsiales bacterium]|nr:4-diphosphocytidyl-2-C-methyl-D-erythritol kinase [Rickettsiales bacterium]